MTMTTTAALDRAHNGSVKGHDDAVDPAAKPTRRRFSIEFKDRIVGAIGADTRITRCYSGKPMRVISNPYVEEREREIGLQHQRGIRHGHRDHRGNG